MKASHSKENLCESCQNCFATCNAENIEFGDGLGNDNVIQCDEYEGDEAEDNDENN